MDPTDACANASKNPGSSERTTCGNGTKKANRWDP